MCGRYASSRKPEDLVEEFEIDKVEVAETLVPDYNVAPTKQVYAVVQRPQSVGGQGRALRASAAHAEVGPGAVLGQGPLDRQQDDQRAHGDRPREAGLPARVRVPSLPAPRRRLLRVVRHRAEDQGRQAREAAVLHPPRRRRRAGDGRALRDLARPHPRRRRPRAVQLDLHGADHHRRGRGRPHPRPDAAAGGARAVRRLARPVASPPSTSSPGCWCPPHPAGSRPTR